MYIATILSVLCDVTGREMAGWSAMDGGGSCVVDGRMWLRRFARKCAWGLGLACGWCELGVAVGCDVGAEAATNV